MKILNNIAGLADESRPIGIALGVFDGVHKGHQDVLSRTLQYAAGTGGTAWVLTFEPHPLKVLRPESAPPLLTSKQHKLRLLESTGIDGCVVMQFTEELAQMAPRAFVETLCTSAPSLGAIYVGQNWRFGKGGQGDVALLTQLAADANVSIEVAEPILWQDEVISSSRIRDAVSQGNLDSAAAMLDRPFSILGTVTRGKSLGRRLGYPTANLDPHNEVHPPLGVYAVRAILDGEDHRGVMNIGVRPTFEVDEDVPPSLELHLPGMDRSLYGHDIEVLFLKWLRDEKKFSTPDDLKRQIAIDIQQATRY
jgi:riboflavin kinase/FMN adenylyltransferase